MKRPAWLLCICLWLLCTAAPVAAQLLVPPDRLSIDNLVGEHHSYRVDFLIFTRVAVVDLSLETTDVENVYRAVMMGRTQGLAALLTRERTQSYVSLMQWMPDGRLRSLEHESRIIKRKGKAWKDRGKRYRFDYAQRKIFQEKARDGEYRPGQVYDMAPGCEPVDSLTALYNLRLGAYGPLEAGAHFEVTTVARGGLSDIIIDVMTPQEQARHKFFPPGGVLVRVQLDQDVFETEGGYVYVWFNRKLEPDMGILEDLIGAGDVRGTMEETADEPTD